MSRKNTLKDAKKATYKDIYYVMDEVKHGSYVIVNLIFGVLTALCSLLIITLFSVGLMDWCNVIEINVGVRVTLIVIFVLLGIAPVVFATWLFVKNRKFCRKIDMWLVDSVAVMATVRALGLNSVDISNGAYEVTLHFSQGDVVKMSGGLSGYLSVYDGKTVEIYYSEKYDKLLFPKITNI